MSTANTPNVQHDRNTFTATAFSGIGPRKLPGLPRTSKYDQDSISAFRRSIHRGSTDKCGLPLIRLFLQVAQIAPPHARARLQELLLSTDYDREDILGMGNSLSVKLLRLSVSIAAERLRVLIPALLFELSDNDPQLLMRNVGYGYASGFLHVLGVPLTSDMSSANVSNDVNPVTGQWRDAESAEDVPETTDKEKEREVERLFVLFQRLEANGVMRAENR